MGAGAQGPQGGLALFFYRKRPTLCLMLLPETCSEFRPSQNQESCSQPDYCWGSKGQETEQECPRAEPGQKEKTQVS